MTVTHNFENQVVLVTGASIGIGLAVARAFGAAGATVLMVDIDSDRGDEAAASIPGATFLNCDLTSEAQVSRTIESLSSQVERIDVLVNNAGGFGTPGSLESTTSEEWRRLIDVNLTSVFLMTRGALPLLRRSENGRIVNVGSLAGQTSGWRTSPAYAAAKAGVHGLTRVLAWELAEEGITVNTVAPTAVLTERIERLRTEAEHADITASIPLGRYQSPQELAAWILFIASPEAGYMTGQTVSVNGGRLMV